MRHPMLRYGYTVVLLAIAGAALSTSGCRSVLTTVTYLVQGTDVDAKYDCLEGKKVVVVCRTMSDQDWRDSSVAGDLAKQVGILLRQKGKKIEVIDQRKVAAWIDENSWSEYAEVGKALDADIVLGIDLDSFTLHQSSTLYQGQADVTIEVFDRSQDSGVIVEEMLPRTVYPPNVSIPVTDRPEKEFRREFVGVLADQIGRFFYKHSPYADYATDAQAINGR